MRSDAVETRLRAALAGRLTFETFGEHWTRNFRGALDQGIPLKPGVTALLTHLANTGLPCAIATSTRTERAREHLEQAGIAQHFHSVTGGDQVARGKPAPDIYHKAAASLGLNAPDCIAFEDSDPAATAAIASGARTVQVPDINPPGSQMHEKGHLIAATLLDGAYRVGLYPASH
ncbi:MAG TPA: HAD family hydrolase [Rhodobacteraceae bacterium]|nr:HAD family hydrolase [Paracoccaceae bacterium]